MVTQRLVCREPGKVNWLDVEVANTGPAQVRIRHTYGVEKHGTMQAFIKGYANQRGSWDAEHRIHRPDGVLWAYPVPLGNMQVGDVIDAGADSGLNPGDRVMHFAPFQREIVVDASNVISLPADVDPVAAMLVDPGEFALGAIRDGGVRVGDAVAVFGLGAIGLVTVQVAKLAGAFPIIAIDPLENRRKIALACGADFIIDPTTGDAGRTIRELTQMRGVDVSIDFSGSRHALQAAFRAVGYQATIVYGAFPPPFDAGLDLGGEAHMNRPTIVFSRACSEPTPDHPRWDWSRIRSAVVALIFAGRLRNHGIIGDPIAFDDLEIEYPRIASAPQSVIKLAVSY